MSGRRSPDPLVRAFGFLGLAWRPVVKSLLLGVAGALSALGLAALSAWLITRAWQMPPVLFLSVAITAVRALGISRGLFRYLERLATHDLALGAMATARERVYLALATGSPAYSVTLRRGDLLARIGDDIDEIGNALIRGVIPIGVGLVTSVAAVIIMALVSLWAAAVLAVALVISGVVAPWLAARGSARSINDSAAASAVRADAVTSALWHAPELAVARRRDAVLATARRADDDAVRAADRGLRIEAAAAAATPLALGVSLLAAAVIGIGLASSAPGSLADVASGHGLTPMILGVLILLPLSAFESTGPLTEAGIQLERSRQSAARVMALVDGALARVDGALPRVDGALARVDSARSSADGALARVDGAPSSTHSAPSSLVECPEPLGEGCIETPHPQPNPSTDIPLHRGRVTLRANALRWGWPSSDVLGPDAGLDLDLTPGSRTVVVGPSGSGKSTLLLTLAGLLAPRAGTVECRTVHNESIDIPSATCYFAEEAHIFSTSVKENLRVARGDVSDAEVDAALQAVGLDNWVHSLVDGVDTPLVGGGDAISGGQRRRLLLARAVIEGAPVILLDEPTEHLDATDADALMAEILDSSSGLFGRDQIVVVVTHQQVDVPAGCRVVEVAHQAAMRRPR